MFARRCLLSVVSHHTRSTGGHATLPTVAMRMLSTRGGVAGVVAVTANTKNNFTNNFTTTTFAAVAALTASIGAVALCEANTPTTTTTPTPASPILPPSPVRNESETVCDPDSNLRLPRTVQPITTTRPQELLGLGVRAVTMFNMYVYVVGLYVRRDDLEKVLTSADAAATPEAILSADLVNRIMQSNVERCVMLTPYRKASFAHLRDGFARAAEIRLADIGLAGDSATLHELQEFKRIFPKDNFRVGDELIVAVRGNTLSVHLNGALLGEIESPTLCRTLFTAYIDDRPVSPPAKQSIANGISSIAKELFPQPKAQ